MYHFHLSIRNHISIYLSVSLCNHFSCLYVFKYLFSIYFSTYLSKSINLYLYIYTNPSLYFSIYLSISLSIYFFNLSINLPSSLLSKPVEKRSSKTDLTLGLCQRLTILQCQNLIYRWIDILLCRQKYLFI